jgi:hypothetical protein
MKPAGRPREFDQLLQSEFLDHVGQGATVAQAAKIVGTSLRTVQREAKLNDDFHTDLKLALETAPVNPERLMGQAARAHWRAAAWMLERSEPDRYGKRPPHSCSVENLQGIMTQLIELALETTPAEQREAVYGRMRSVADKALDVLTPDQREGRRWMQALATRATPLSDDAIGNLEGGRKEPDDQRHDELDGEQSDAGLPWTAPDGVAIAGSIPPDGGIMSPKMHVATNGKATDFAAMGPVPMEPASIGPAATELAAEITAAANGSPPRPKGRNAKSVHVLEKAQARRARRQAARAKRKGRRAA